MKFPSCLVFCILLFVILWVPGKQEENQASPKLNAKFPWVDFLPTVTRWPDSSWITPFSGVLNIHGSQLERPYHRIVPGALWNCSHTWKFWPDRPGSGTEMVGNPPQLVLIKSSPWLGPQFYKKVPPWLLKFLHPIPMGRGGEAGVSHTNKKFSDTNSIPTLPTWK